MTDDLRLDEPGDDLPGRGSGAADPTAALLRGVLHRQADAVTPSPDGYARIRAEIERRQPRRGRWGARGFAPALAAAAALVVVAAAGTAVVRSVVPRPDAPPAGVTLRTPDDDVRATPGAALPVYVAGEQNGRLVLFREFRQPAPPGDAAAQVEAAVRLALTARPADADHVRLFAPAERLTVQATVTDQLVTVDISPAPRPAGGAVGRDGATAAVQQLVWTATAAAAVSTTPGSPSPSVTRSASVAAQPVRSVRITLDGAGGGSLFGLVSLDRAFDRQFGGDPRAPVWVIDPAEGGQVGRGPLVASGDAVAGDDSAVRVRLLRDGREVAEQDVPLTPQAGATGPVRRGQRGAWRAPGWDVRAPGRYRIEASATDAEARTWTDTKTFTVG